MSVVSSVRLLKSEQLEVTTKPRLAAGLRFVSIEELVARLEAAPFQSSVHVPHAAMPTRHRSFLLFRNLRHQRFGRQHQRCDRAGILQLSTREYFTSRAPMPSARARRVTGPPC